MAEKANAPVQSEPVTDPLLEKLDRGFAPAWIPEEGDTLVGYFARLELASTAFGPARVAVIVTADGEEHGVWLFYEALKTGFLRARPVPGERIAIRYNGEKPSKNPTPGRKETYHDYSVAVDRPIGPGGPVDWDAELGAPATVTLAEPAVEPSPDDIPY